MNILCELHGMDYELNCLECWSKEDLFLQQVEKAQRQLSCNHDTIDLGDTDHLYLVCKFCGIKTTDTEFYILPDYKGLPN